MSRPYDEVWRDVLHNGVPAMRRAKYKLVSEEDNRLLFSRRYLPSSVVRVSLLVLIVGLLIRLAADHFTPFAAISWVAILALLFYRRRENVALELCPSIDGTRVVVAGGLWIKDELN